MGNSSNHRQGTGSTGRSSRLRQTDARNLSSFACPYCDAKCPNYEELQMHMLTVCEYAAVHAASLTDQNMTGDSRVSEDGSANNPFSVLDNSEMSLCDSDFDSD